MNFESTNLQEIIIEFLRTPKTISEIMSFTDNDKNTKKQLEALEQANEIFKYRGTKYASAAFLSIYKGEFCATEKTFGFVAPLNLESEDIFIPERKTMSAMNGDIVLFKLLKTNKDKTEGEIIKILEHKVTKFIGTIFSQNNIYIIEPDMSKLPYMVVQAKDLNGAVPGQKVGANIVDYGSASANPLASVEIILSDKNELEYATSSILYQNNIATSFSKNVIDEAEAISAQIAPEDIKYRKDLRRDIIFTIDGDTSKDFDDAVSISKSKNGYVIGVHIADVSHYVKEGSSIDNEAIERGTSLYYADKVIPMLPFKLSNNICSLVPNEDRLTLSASIEIDKAGNVLSSKIFKSIINSKKRLTYSEVNEFFKGKKSFDKEIADSLNLMNEASAILNKKRTLRGALELDIKEAKLIIKDEKMTDLAVLHRGASEKLIEEFMLLANEVVAAFMKDGNIPSIYRVHERPNKEKLKVFALFAGLFGYKIPKGKEDDTFTLQKILDEAEGHPTQKVLKTVLLRSLSRAKYSSESVGHYGLATDLYLHFTSPIRRYPDLMVHRVLTCFLRKKNYNKYFKVCSFVAEKSTKKEYLADISSRDIERVYIAQYMNKFLGKEFDAIICSVQSFGFFVELPNTAEGLVRIDDLASFEFISDKMMLASPGKKYRIGDEVKVRLTRACTVTGQLDFSLIN